MRFRDICTPDDTDVSDEDAALDAAAGRLQLYCTAVLPDATSEEIEELVSLVHYDLASLFDGLTGEERRKQAGLARTVMDSMCRLEPDQLMHDLRFMVRGEQVEPVEINERITFDRDIEEPGECIAV